MLFTRIWLISMDVGLEHRRRVIFTVTSEVMEAVMQFVALDITV